MFTVSISTENAAFYDEDGNYEPVNELVRLLRILAETLEDDVRRELADPSIAASQGGTWDRNGNCVGEWRHDRPS